LLELAFVARTVPHGQPPETVLDPIDPITLVGEVTIRVDVTTLTVTDPCDWFEIAMVTLSY
jgi:hypothetical protein